MVKKGLITITINGIICLKMEMRIISIYHSDGEYARAMAERLCLKLRGVKVAAENSEKVSGREVYVMERYTSASGAAEEISEKFCVIKQADGEGPCVLTGFLSGAGGSGTTSAAIAMGRIYTELYGYKTLYLSFDRLALKSGLSAENSMINVYNMVFGQEFVINGNVFAQDSSGLFYMGTKGIVNPVGFLNGAMAASLIDRLSGRFERMVLDIPYNWEGAMDLIDLCDNIAVCFGWQQERWSLSEVLSEHYKGIRDRVFEFRPFFDEYGTEDIYGQFGSEVRALAQQIEES